MSLLSDIKNFKKASLKSTETLLRTEDGTEYLESKDEYGHIKKHVVSVGTTLGYLADLKPDLQVGEIMPGLILGSQDVAGDLDLLQQYHVTHILNVASMVENLYPDKFTYKTLNIYDLPHVNIVQYFPACFAFIDEALESNGCVLVHCNAGVSRSASIVIGYLMKNKQMTFEEAFSHVKEKRPATRPNKGFMRQLKEYQP